MKHVFYTLAFISLSYFIVFKVIKPEIYASNAHTVERLTHFNSTKYYVKMQMIPIGIHLN